MCEGAYNEKVLPVCLAAAGLVSAEGLGAMQTAMEVVVRDKNQALDQLDKVGVWKVGGGEGGLYWEVTALRSAVACHACPLHDKNRAFN